MVMRTLIDTIGAGWRTVERRAEDLALAGAWFGGCICVCAAGFMVYPAAGVAVTGAVLAGHSFLYVRGVKAKRAELEAARPQQ